MIAAQIAELGTDSPCIESPNRPDKHGYAQKKLRGKTTVAHRVAYLRAYGAIPNGALVLHRCDNRRCINPAHLFAGTHADNMRDMVAKGRQARGSRGAGAKLTYDDVLWIRWVRSYAGASNQAIASAFGTCRSNISMIMTGVNWTHSERHMPTGEERAR